MRRTALTTASVLLAGLALSAPAEAKPHACGKLVRPATVYRVIAIRGVSCRTARHIAKLDASGTAPAPWHCEVGFGERYRGREIGSKCGHGGRGAVLRRRHAFVTVILHNVG